MTRADLYALVWSTPMIHAARRFGISDVALRKTCVREGVPVPPQGHWAKLAHGKKTPKQPALNGNAAARVNLVLKVHIPLPEQVAAAAEAAREREDRPEARIVVPEGRPERLHPVAAKVERALLKAKPDAEGFLSSEGPGPISVRVGRDSIERATVLVDTFLNALAARGFWVDGGRDGTSRIAVDGIDFSLAVTAGRDQQPHIPTKAELKAQADRDEQRRRWPSSWPEGSMAYRKWDYVPSARLSFEIEQVHPTRWMRHKVGRWGDRAGKSVERHLNAAMAALVEAAAHIRHKQEEAAERERRRAEEAERQRREQARLERARKRAEFVQAKAEEHAALLRLEAFLAHLEAEVVEAGGTDPVDRIAAELRDALRDRRLKLGRAALNTAIEGAGLYEDQP